MQAQDKAGFLKDITSDMAAVDQTLAPTAVDAFKVGGKVVGTPFEVGEVVFYYNKKLFEKAGVKAEDVKSWDDFLCCREEAQGRGHSADRRRRRREMADALLLFLPRHAHRR